MSPAGPFPCPEQPAAPAIAATANHAAAHPLLTLVPIMPLRRSRGLIGSLLRGSVAVRAFAKIGWTWGGTFRHGADPMHFTATGA
jgi:hypothetical protein